MGGMDRDHLPMHRLLQISRHFTRKMTTSGPTLSAAKVNFPKTPVGISPLGPGNYVRTAACLIIGDEVLNGKTRDSNSNYFARLMFDLGVEVKRIEVIADDESEIIEAARRLTAAYDFVVTSGGIGPTHDDITYEALSKAFDMPLAYDDETKRRMAEASKHRVTVTPQTPAQALARNRMALFPSGGSGVQEVLFVESSLWVPVVRLKGKLCILPGVPSLFQQLLTGL